MKIAELFETRVAEKIDPVIKLLRQLTNTSSQVKLAAML